MTLQKENEDLNKKNVQLENILTSNIAHVCDALNSNQRRIKSQASVNEGLSQGINLIKTYLNGLSKDDDNEDDDFSNSAFGEFFTNGSEDTAVKMKAVENGSDVSYKVQKGELRVVQKNKDKKRKAPPC